MNKCKAALFFCLLIFLHACTTIRMIRNKPQNKPFLVQNDFVVKGGNFNAIEKEAVILRLTAQLDDSAKVRIKSPVFFIDILPKPTAYDTGYSRLSAKNMKASMFHLGYYDAVATFKADTNRRKVTVKYTLEAGKQTTIDTMVYRLSKPDLQTLALQSKPSSYLKEGYPINKVSVLGEIARLVDSFRNNGYYKFTAAELKLRGDTTIAALTTVSDDPFEQLDLLSQAAQQRDSPTIKLQMVLNPPEDVTKLWQYKVNNIYVLQDFRPGDNFNDTTSIKQRLSRNKNLILRFHERYVKTRLLTSSIFIQKDSLFKQNDFYRTLTQLTKAGVWQSINIRTEELKDSAKLNFIIELIPAKKFGFETSIEASYSAASNTNAALGGNLFGLSINFGLTNRNIAKEAIKMTHGFRAGVEFNNNSRIASTNIINSNEFTYTNNILFPKRIAVLPVKSLKEKSGESFINSKVSLINRLFLFSLQSYSLNFGSTINLKKQQRLTFRPINIEFNGLNKTDSFNKIIQDNPFLRYSYTTSFILGTSASYSSVYNNPRHLLSLTKERFFRISAEESGLTIGALPILNKFKSNYFKTDIEYKYTVGYVRTAMVFRLFAGLGVPLAGDSSLPFFKQYFGGGSNSMRGWPIRGVGRGNQKLAPFGTIFNDRTGDIQFEGNAEYRYDIARIIPNTLTLRGALFIDAGNIWNFRNTSTTNIADSAQFRFRDFYKQLGVSAGTGFRLDFNYFVLRFDLGFRFKRPESSDDNSGWKLPPMKFKDAFQKMFFRGQDDEYRRWRYENFNLTIGISYPF